MTYSDLIRILLSNDVYDKLKEYESDLFKLIPELEICKGFEQNNKWHIYDVYEHILHVVSGVSNDICLKLAALFHDVGKPLTYVEDSDGVGHFYNHWNKSIEIFQKYQDKFNLSNDQINLINNLIFYHDINVDKLSNDEIINMINQIGIKNIQLLFDLKRADLLAQSPEFHDLLININKQENNMIKK